MFGPMMVSAVIILLIPHIRLLLIPRRWWKQFVISYEGSSLPLVKMIPELVTESNKEMEEISISTLVHVQVLCMSDTIK